MKNIKYKILNKFIIMTMVVAGMFTCNLTANAGYEGNGQVSGSVTGDIPISISSQPLYFDDHKGMQASINGQPVFCIQRGYPFRSMVSELQMVTSNIDGESGTIASLLRILLRGAVGDISTRESAYFRGFGTWEINDDHTDAVLVSTDGAPSSLAWLEAFDEDMDDDEDTPYETRYQGDGSIRKFTVEIIRYLTGHEGALEPFKTQMKKITYEEAGFDIF